MRPTLNGLKIYAVKAAPGRGRTKSCWSVELSKALLADFDRFRKAGVKSNARMLMVMAHELIGQGHTMPYNY